MATAMNVRATSFGASALVIGAVMFAALTMTTQIDLRSEPPAGPGAIDIVHEDLPPPPPPPTPRPIQHQEMINPVADDMQRVATIPDAIPTETSFPVAADTGPVEISQPRWTRRPSNLQRYYPPRGVDRNIEGVVMLDCLVSVTGALQCSVLSETPRGWGFAEAALRMSRDYAMVPATRDGLPVEGRYRMRVPFDLQ